MYKSILALLACVALSSAKKCTYTADFDKKVDVATRPPNGYKHLKWSTDGYISATPAVSTDGIPGAEYNGNSKPNVLSAATSVNLGTAANAHDYGALITLKSFDVACYLAVPHTIAPIGCTLLVTAATGQLGNRSTFRYDIEPTSEKKPKFFHVDNINLKADNFDFRIIGAPAGKYELEGGSNFALDNIVTVQDCKH